MRHPSEICDTVHSTALLFKGARLARTVSENTNKEALCIQVPFIINCFDDRERETLYLQNFQVLSSPSVFRLFPVGEKTFVNTEIEYTSVSRRCLYLGN